VEKLAADKTSSVVLQCLKIIDEKRDLANFTGFSRIVGSNSSARASEIHREKRPHIADDVSPGKRRKYLPVVRKIRPL